MYLILLCVCLAPMHLLAKNQRIWSYAKDSRSLALAPKTMKEILVLDNLRVILHVTVYCTH